MNFDLTSPIIATGRGGNGTRLITPLLEQAGVFMGNELNVSGDGLEWKQITLRMLKRNISIKDGNFSLRWQRQLTTNAREILEKAPADGRTAWGWKLPEVLHFLPEFLAAFPNAKIVHMVRHPLSTCMRRTHLSSRLNNKVGNIILPAAYRFLGKDSSQIARANDSMNNAISWEYQLRSFLDTPEITALSADRLLQVKYEDLANDTAGTFSRMCDFLGIGNSTLNQIDFDASRFSEVDLTDESAVEIWELCKDTAIKLGYSDNPRQDIRYKES